MFEEGGNGRACLGIIYNLAALVTFVKLTFLDSFHYTWLNWIIVLPIDVFLATIWPIYWLILRPLFH